jgi:hypothetical protein
MCALVLLAVYNFWQIHNLRGEVARLKVRPSVKSVEVRESPGDSNKLLGKARLHADEARKYLMKGDTRRATTELEKSLLVMKRAGKDVAGPSKSAIDKMQQSLDDLHRKVARLRDAWDKASDKPGGG